MKMHKNYEKKDVKHKPKYEASAVNIKPTASG